MRPQAFIICYLRIFYLFFLYRKVPLAQTIAHTIPQPDAHPAIWQDAGLPPVSGVASGVNPKRAMRLRKAVFRSPPGQGSPRSGIGQVKTRTGRAVYVTNPFDDFRNMGQTGPVLCPPRSGDTHRIFDPRLSASQTLMAF